ncbi:MAG: phosphatidylserine decarboxylase [Magnetospirillum sp. WYHS-4]
MNIILVPIHPAGWPFIAVFAAATLGLAFVAEPLGWLGVALTAWCAYFFRDPDRVTPQGESLAVAPADGVVCLIDEAVPPPQLDMGDDPRPRVCIFMNVFNVHVNRAPLAGRIGKLAYVPGRFVNASLDKASEFNERQCVRLTTPAGQDIAFVQIAGLVARRIVCFVKEGDELQAGERFGLIRFGSRVDTYLPANAAPQVCVGQKTIAGETVIADLASREPPRRGEVR